MFDPAVLGTTMIGLEEIRREADLYERGVAQSPRARRQIQPLRRSVAAALRRTAALIEPVRVPAR